MKLIPKIADTEIRLGDIKIFADRSSLELIQAAVGEASGLTEVNALTLLTVVSAAKRLHKLISEVDKSRKEAKADFLKANKDIETLATKIVLPLKSHYDRLTNLLAAWHDAEERRKEDEERRREEAEEAAAAEERRQAEEEERQRQVLIKRQKEAKTFAEQEQANLELSFVDSDIPVEVNFGAIEIPSATQWPEYKAPIPGATTTKRYKFTLVDPVAAYQFSKQLVRWDIAVLAAQDIVRSQLEQHLEPKIPGVKIETYTDVTTPSARS